MRASSPDLYIPQVTEHSRRHFPPSPESPIRLYNTGLSSRSSSRSPERMARPPAPSGLSVSYTLPPSGSWGTVAPGGRADESIRRGRSRSRSIRGTGGFEDIVAPPSPQCCRVELPSSRSGSVSRTTRTPSPGLAVRRNGSPYLGFVRGQPPIVIHVPPSSPKITTDSTRYDRTIYSYFLHFIHHVRMPDYMPSLYESYTPSVVRCLSLIPRCYVWCKSATHN